MGKYDHQFHERDDDLSHCKVCGGAEGSLPTLCPGRAMIQEEQDAVYAAELDFNTGPMVGAQWWTKLSPKIPGMTGDEVQALPVKARNYIHQLAANTDPSGMVRENAQLLDTNAGLQIMYRKAADALESANTDLKDALDSAEKSRQQLLLMEEHARGEVWRWQADGADHLESMGGRMGVLIYASDLRDLIAAPPSVNVINALMAADEALKDSADTLRRLQDSSMAGQIESAHMLITAALPPTTPGFTVSKEGWGTGWEAGGATVIKLDPTPLETLLAYEAPPLASDYDGFICEMADQYGATMINDDGSVYAFTQEQLIAFTKANRAPARSQGVITHIPMADGKELEFEPYVIDGSIKLWALKRDGAHVRYLNQFEHGFVDAAIHATRLQTDRPAIDQLVKAFRAIGDQMYCDYIAQMRRDVCLGWESKVHSRKFSAVELEAHTKAGELLGRHRAFHDAAHTLAQLGSQPVPTETGKADATTVQVPKVFIQEFMTLAHNYSLYAEAPDFYFGTERDAFQNAYRRCGGDLAKVKDLLTKPEGDKL